VFPSPCWSYCLSFGIWMVSIGISYCLFLPFILCMDSGVKTQLDYLQQCLPGNFFPMVLSFGFIPYAVKRSWQSVCTIFSQPIVLLCHLMHFICYCSRHIHWKFLIPFEAIQSPYGSKLTSVTGFCDIYEGHMIKIGPYSCGISVLLDR